MVGNAMVFTDENLEMKDKIHMQSIKPQSQSSLQNKLHEHQLQSQRPNSLTLHKLWNPWHSK